ncbi:MAG: GHKL domain-containing protein [Sporocytophaga sp.]|uniref:PAS domain-containing sensor histidine kinase n=1 Tax=Sporocytophaga sp. TaxID=2231183 RepID=UPI001B0DF23F|nr:ATP-binding protein [Sporocytophaga sp.]MBO9701447.1 GHKL domain-containing protein [Sporocytophaga sp.]
MATKPSPDTKSKHSGFLSGEGEMVSLIRKFDWSKTSVGPIEQWPQSLKTMVSMILLSKFPMFIWWGEDLVQFYNDAYRPSLGNNGKHPNALGQKGKNCWQEIWNIIYPLINQVMTTGEATWSEDQLIPIYRNGKIEDVYWTFGYSPIIGDSGEISGVLVVCNETTEKVLNSIKLKESKDQLHFAIESSELATWEYNPVTNVFKSNNRLKEWIGIPLNTETSLEEAITNVVSSEREAVREAIKQSFEYSSGGLFNVVCTILHPLTGVERTVRAKGRTYFDLRGEPYRFSGIIQDISEEEMAKKELADSRKSLELRNVELLKINNDLDNFIYTASHDLKAPISNIEGLLQAYMMDGSFNEEQQSLIDMMLFSIERFKTTIKDLTEISKVQRVGNLEPEVLTFSEMYNEVILDIRELIKISNDPVIVTDFKVDTIKYSRKNLRSIIYNLLSNALKYSSSERRPEIHLSTESADNFVLLTISDNGLGISSENQHKIFNMFERAHQHVEGSGIGLYIIKRIIENSGGKIELQSTEGVGTTFKVYLKNL